MSVRRSSALAAVVAVWVAVVAPPRLSGQGAGGTSPAATPGRFTAATGARFSWIREPGERHAQEALADSLLKVLRLDPAISHPVGYDVSLRPVAAALPKGFNTGMAYRAGVEGQVRIFGIGDVGNGRQGVTVVDEVDLRVYVNDRWCGERLFSDSLSDGGPPIVEGLPRTPPVHGHPSYDGLCVLITPGSAPPFLSLSRDRYRRLQITQIRATIKRSRGQLAGMLADPTYGPMARAGLDTAQRFVDSLQRVADAASPADRDAPAAVRIDGPGDSTLVDVGTPNSDPEWIPNPAFFDAALPRTRAQAIVLWLPYGVRGADPYTYDSDEPGRRAVFTKIVDGLPWAALESMVKH